MLALPAGTRRGLGGHPMNVLVTAGNTLVPDRPGPLPHQHLHRPHRRRHRPAGPATAATRDAADLAPGSRAELHAGRHRASERWQLHPYRTFDDLHEPAWQRQLPAAGSTPSIHCAAVSDYLMPAASTPRRRRRASTPTTAPGAAKRARRGCVDRAAGKVKSDEPELWLRLVRAPKLVDRVRADWGFRGVLVKFKLEVGISDDTAARDRRASAPAVARRPDGRQHAGGSPPSGRTWGPCRDG